jgi:E-phenylitaconyl-CoA hydratase
MAITSAVQDPIATITIDRPEKLNALDPAHLIELRAHLSRASADTVVRVIVVTCRHQILLCRRRPDGAR